MALIIEYNICKYKIIFGELFDGLYGVGYNTYKYGTIFCELFKDLYGAKMASILLDILGTLLSIIFINIQKYLLN